MRGKKIFFFLSLLGVFSLSYFLIHKIFPRNPSYENTEHAKSKLGSYFFPITISKFTRANLPCLSLEINGDVVSAILDLGFRGELGFLPQFLDHIENKKYLRSEKMYGIRGGEYEEKLYEVPMIQIGPISFFNPTFHEYTEDFHRDAIIITGDDGPSMPEPGKVGWELFGNTNLFLDLGNSQVAFCDSLETLAKQGYLIETFIKTPLLLERGLVELRTETPEGTLRCMLDTGATYNILNAEIEEGQTLDQAMREPTNLLEYTSFKIESKDFGPIAFHRMPIKIPIRIEAILGMEFFQDSLVFLDFAEEVAYISKSEEIKHKDAKNTEESMKHI